MVQTNICSHFPSLLSRINKLLPACFFHHSRTKSICIERLFAKNFTMFCARDHLHKRHSSANCTFGFEKLHWNVDDKCETESWQIGMKYFDLEAREITKLQLYESIWHLKVSRLFCKLMRLFLFRCVVNYDVTAAICWVIIEVIKGNYTKVLSSSLLWLL